MTGGGALSETGVSPQYPLEGVAGGTEGGRPGVFNIGIVYILVLFNNGIVRCREARIR